MIYRKKLPEGNSWRLVLFVMFLYPVSQGLDKRFGGLHHPPAHINGNIDGRFAGHAYHKGIWHTECRLLARRGNGTRIGFLPRLYGEWNCYVFAICWFPVIICHE